MKFIVGLFVGLFVGAIIGFFLAALCAANGRDNDHEIHFKDRNTKDQNEFGGRYDY